MSVPSVPQPYTVDAGAAEIQRIRAEYDRRKRELPSDFYSWGRQWNYFHHTQLVRQAIAALAKEEMFPLEGRRVADIGCGVGKWLLEFAQWGASDLHGIDLDEARIRQAQERFPSACLHAGDARSHPWEDESFELVSQFVVFTSILDNLVKRQIAREMMRVVKPHGVILWFDFLLNNPNNSNVRGIGSREIEALFPGCTVKVRRVTLAPPIARLIVPLSWTVASVLEKLPFLRTHNLAIISKSQA